VPSRDPSRKTEGLLSFYSIGLLLFTFLLVYHAKSRPEPAHALLVNEATAEQFAQALGVEPEIAARLVAYRAQKHGFESSEQILDAPLFSRADADRLAPLLTNPPLNPATATAGSFAAGLGVSPPVARRLAGYRDRILPPFSVAASSPPLPDAATFLRHAPLLDPPATRPLLKRILVRRADTVFEHFWIGTALLVLALFFVPPLLRGRWRVAGDPMLLPIAMLLSGLGVAMLFSIKDPLRDGPAYEHHAVGIFLALAVMLFAARLAPVVRGRIRSYQYVWVFAAALLVGALSLFGRGPEGVKLNLFGFQPVEIIKILLVFFLASYLARHADLIADVSRPFRSPAAPPKGPGKALQALFAPPRRQDVGPIVVMFACALTLFYVIKDLGPGLLLFATFVTMLYLTTGRGSFVWIGALLILMGGVFGYYRHIGVFATRVDMWQAPFANTHANGMQLGQAYWAMASGGWEGSGLGLGMPGLIPRAGSDLAFASWVEETGLIGAWLLLTLYALLIWRGIRIALRANNDFDRALAFGLTTLLGLQTLLILGGVTGCLPLTGISLPFLSYGNSALVTDFLIIGLLRSISTPPSGGIGRPDPTPEVRLAARRFALTMTALLLGGIGLWKLGQTQLFQADAIASRAIVTPDADKVRRPHLNPRLLAIANEIERGSLYDRAGRVLATSRYAEILPTVKDEKRARRMADSHARLYPYGPAFAHLVGYLDPRVGGPNGFELAYNADLRGFRTYTELLADYRGRHLPGYRPRRGRDLHLALDADLQRDIQALLLQATGRLKDLRSGRRKDRAAFVLMDPQTGAVIAAATTPTFDPNTLTPDRLRQFLAEKDANEEHRFIDRAVAGLYPPGSTLKVATAACALDNLPNALALRFACNQVDTLHWRENGVSQARTVRDDKGDPPFGSLTLTPAFRVSSNIYFANLAVTIGSETLRTTLREKMGFRHTPGPKLFPPDLADIGYGQGRMLASPLEMCRLAAAVANKGTMCRPRFVTGLTDPADPAFRQDFPQPAPLPAMKPTTAATLRDLMRSVVTGGTARGVFTDARYAVAGKTGTAQNRQFDREPHSWFIGFAPCSDQTPPRYAFACVVENGGYGKRVAAVLCRDVLKFLPLR
jgi:cell division protein FtsW (lipid II flippase)